MVWAVEGGRIYMSGLEVLVLLSISMEKIPFQLVFSRLDGSVVHVV